ncbi:MAG: flavodoxin family protein [Spirochaetales bacterium]|nr:flavodoxin family protein [Spirochaetales bacterium]
MKALVVYDSVFGNTEKVAKAIGEALGPPEEVTTAPVGEARQEQLSGLDVLVVGSPTRAFKCTPGITGFLKRIPAGSLKGVQVSAFDTRIPVTGKTPGFLKVMIKLFGYAAEPMAKTLQKKGGNLKVAAGGFIVEGTEGPLKEGELERAAEWAKELAAY